MVIKWCNPKISDREKKNSPTGGSPSTSVHHWRNADSEFYRDASSFWYGNVPKIQKEKIDKTGKELQDRNQIHLKSDLVRWISSSILKIWSPSNRSNQICFIFQYQILSLAISCIHWLLIRSTTSTLQWHTTLRILSSKDDAHLWRHTAKAPKPRSATSVFCSICLHLIDPLPSCMLSQTFIDIECKSFSGRCKFLEEKDIDLINDRNEHFN